jgi:hypothetical protein
MTYDDVDGEQAEAMDLVERMFRELNKDKSTETSKFITALYHVAHVESGYPPVADPFLQIIMFNLPGLNGAHKVQNGR